MKKRILFVIPTLRLGGAEKALSSLLNCMDSDKYDLNLLLFAKEGELLDTIPDCINVIEVDKKTRAMVLEGRYYFKDLIKGFYIGAMFTRLLIYASTKLKPLKKLVGEFSWKRISKHIAPIEGHYDVAIGFLEGYTDFFVIDKVNADRKIGWIHSDMSKRSVSEEEQYYAAFDALATISKVCLDAFCEKFPSASDKIRVVENIVSSAVVRSSASRSVSDVWRREAFNIVSVGRLYAEKGYDMAIDTCRLLKDRGYDVVWHVYGSGALKGELERKIANLGLKDAFLLEGVRENPYPYMSAADVLVQSSRYEGKSIVLDETKILGKPIVVTNYLSVADQITDGVTGIVVAMDAKSIADGVERIINDPILAAKLGENCLKCENTSIRALEEVYSMIEHHARRIAE